jgi:RimJ/RimL family protein N-acetyltransferase
LERQVEWLSRYYERAGDWYFVIEGISDGQPEGLVSLYDLSADGLTAEWGRWILRPSSLAAVESAWLIYRCAFECLELMEVYCRTVALNESVVSFHDSCGISRKSLLPNHFEMNGRAVDAIEHRVSFAEWSEIRLRLGGLAHVISRRVIK